MYSGYTESAEKIEARKRRILANYKPAKKAVKKTGSRKAPKGGK
jgi:hypothetical protein